MMRPRLSAPAKGAESVGHDAPRSPRVRRGKSRPALPSLGGSGHYPRSSRKQCGFDALLTRADRSLTLLAGLGCGVALARGDLIFADGFQTQSPEFSTRVYTGTRAGLSPAHRPAEEKDERSSISSIA